VATPFNHAGQLIRIRRAKPSRFINDLAITRSWTRVRVDLIGAAADLAAGVPALTWRIIDLAPSRGEDDQTRALAGWRHLREMTTSLTAREWDLLRRAHSSAQPVVAAISVGLRPHTVAANPKSVNDALARLRELGLAWQPQPRVWALADPLLAAWARDHAPLPGLGAREGRAEADARRICRSSGLERCYISSKASARRPGRIYLVFVRCRSVSGVRPSVRIDR
jgi:hypothetical protein